MPVVGASQQPAPAPPPPLLLLLLLLLAPAARAACRISEMACRSSSSSGGAAAGAGPRCVPLDRFCDSRRDCADGSDEPPGCSICNRTLYGDVGRTYEIVLLRPRDVRPPFFCHITFTASGLSFGDLVQLTFDELAIGRVVPAVGELGCPDGHLQLAELGRPQPGGPWCGSGGGPDAVFYSEASTITLSVRLFADPPPPTKPPPFRFRLRYKFVSRTDAVVRFGDSQLSPSKRPLQRGEPVPGSYCGRNFFECYRQHCRLQSPNFPGLFPRNVTCILSLRQKEVPRCKHAMISVSPAPSMGSALRKSYVLEAVRPSGVGVPTTTAVTPAVPATATDLCPEDSDHLVFYDGPSTNDPVLARWCASNEHGVALQLPPKVLSRGADLVVAFHSSPYAAPVRATPAFQLDVEVMFADSDSLDFQREGRRCEFEVNATAASAGRLESRSGQIISPRHTLSPNTTCKYHLRGTPSDRVWLFFLAYSVTPAPTGNCATRLRVWDGGGSSGLLLLGAHCGEGGPKLCAHAALRNATSAPRPCGPHESYESSGPDLTVHLSTTAGTALQPAYFRLRYEFVETDLGGDPLVPRLAWISFTALSTGAVAPPAPAAVAASAAATSQPLPGSLAVPTTASRPPIACARLFRNRRTGDVHSPRNVFMFGRGGAVNLTCVYRIEAAAGEHIRLTVQNASLAGDCITLADAHTGRPTCMYRTGARAAELRVWEAPWKDVRLPRACICGSSTTPLLPFVYTSAARVLELTLTVSSMTPAEDQSSVYFHASFDNILSEGSSTAFGDCSLRRRISGSGGEISFTTSPRNEDEKRCAALPWLVEAHRNHSLFLMTWGTPLPPVAATLPASSGVSVVGSTVTEEAAEDAKCHTRSRLMLYSGRPLKLSRVFCPLPPTDRHSAVQVFSEEWLGAGATPVSATPPWGRPPPSSPPTFLVEFVARDEARTTLHWLEISRPRSALQHWPSEEDAGVAMPTNASAMDPECPHRCPELNACIAASLWCDGRVNCPSGADEQGPYCGSLSQRILALLPDSLVMAAAAGAAAGAALCVLLTALAVARARRRRRRNRSRSKSLLLLAKADSTTLSSLASVDGVGHVVNSNANYHINSTGVDYNPYGCATGS